MRPVLIVDDEPLVRLTLRTSVPWERHGFVYAGEASNGEKALKALRERPDTALVILDLAMPHMNGLEFLRRMAAQGLRPQVIVLSAHDDFPMVREAFKLGVTDYLLKSEMDPARIEDLLDAAARRIELLGDPAPIETADVSRTAAVKQELLVRFLSSREPSGLRDEMENWGIHVGPVFCLGILVVSDFEIVAARYDSSSRTSLSAGLLAVVEQVLGRLRLGEVVRMTDDEYVLVLSSAEPRADSRFLETCLRAGDDIARALASYLNIGVSVRFSDAVELGRGASPADLCRALAAGRSRPSRLVTRAQEHILRNYQDPELHLTELSRHLGVTPNHLSALFAREAGRSFREYLALVRIEAGKRLLAGSSLKVWEVAEKIGFLNVEHFSRVFKRLTGVPPHLFTRPPTP